jgi:hypothetical protein
MHGCLYFSLRDHYLTRAYLQHRKFIWAGAARRVNKAPAARKINRERVAGAAASVAYAAARDDFSYHISIHRGGGARVWRTHATSGFMLRTHPNTRL